MKEGGGGEEEYSYNQRIILKMCYIQAPLDFVRVIPVPAGVGQCVVRGQVERLFERGLWSGL